MNILIKNVTAILPDMSAPVTDIAIKDDRIFSIGTIPQGFSADETIDGTDMLAVPGFINAHTHASMTLLRSYADDMALMDWLNKYIWPVEAKMVSDDIYWGAALAAVEMLEGGTTTFADMYGPHMERVAEVCAESGLRGVLSQGLIGVAGEKTASEKLAANVQLFHDWQGKENGRIKVMLGPHAPYTCPPDFLRKIAETAQELHAEIHIHMAETEDEIKQIKERYGKRPFAYVESTGLFENGTLAAHCVHLDDEDISIIKRHQIRVAHNPGSNLKLASGIAPTQRLLQEGVCIGIGTDGASSNNNLDMLQEMQLAALIEKVKVKDPLAVPAEEAFKMGTEYGARAVGLPEIGKIEAGKKADITLISMKDASWYPRHHVLSLLIYSGHSADVDTVICDGRILMRHRELQTLDKEIILFEASKCAKRLTE